MIHMCVYLIRMSVQQSFKCILYVCLYNNNFFLYQQLISLESWQPVKKDLIWQLKTSEDSYLRAENQ